MSRPTGLITATAALSAAGAVVCSVLAGWGSPGWWALPLMALAIAAAERASVRLVVGRQAIVFALHEAFVAVGLVFAPGAWIAVAYVLGIGLVQFRTQWVKLRFNLAMFSFSAAAGALVTEALGGGLLAASVGLLTIYTINHLLVSVPIALTTGQSYGRVLVYSGTLGLIHFAGTASLGLLGAWLALHAPLGLLGLVVPLALLWSSYDEQTRRAAEARLFAELARRPGAGHRPLQSTRRPRSSLTAAARLFGGADVEMLCSAAGRPAALRR